MKLSTVVRASVVTWALLIVGVVPAIAATVTVGNVDIVVKKKGLTTGPNTKKPCLDSTGKPIPGQFHPYCGTGQSTTVNSSRSNIKNN